MARVARRVRDKRVLVLIRRYLQAGLMEGGIVSQRREGTPQGGPLSPLLSNILLDDLDKELEIRGHAFCRYADDCNIYVQTRRSGERVMESVTQFFYRTVKVEGQCDKKRSGPPMESEISQLHDDQSQESATQSRAESGRSPETGRAPGNPLRKGPLAQDHDRYPCAKAARLGELLQVGGCKECFRRARRMVKAKAAKHPLAAMETFIDEGEEPDAHGTGRRTGLEIRHQRARPVVELRGLAHEPGFSQEIL